MIVMRSLIAFLVFSSIALAEWGFGPKVVTVEAYRSKNKILLNFDLKKGYGVQKGGPNKITIYKLKPGHAKVKTVREKIKHFGSAVRTIKKLNGKTAFEDKKYFSKLNSVIIRDKDYSKGDYVYQAKFFYCSFASKFCSVQSIAHSIL